MTIVMRISGMGFPILIENSFFKKIQIRNYMCGYKLFPSCLFPLNYDTK